ncbi:MAG: hypothetical protein ACYC49_19980, partial [Ignavibacteriaceae bacterium]
MNRVDMVIKSFTILLIFFILNNFTFAQSTLTGKITDIKNDIALKGASVYIPDLKIGAISQNKGTY